MKIPAPLIVATLVLCTATAPLTAQVVYSREIAVTSGDPVLPLTQAPIDTGDPLYNSGLPHTQRIYTDKNYYYFDPDSGIASAPATLPPNIKIDPNTLVTVTGIGTSDPFLRIIGARSTLWNYSIGSSSTIGSIGGVPVPFLSIASLAAPNRDDLTAIANGAFYSVAANGAVTQIYSITGGTSAGEFSFDTRYHAYGPNGLLYALDYGNNRVQMLDPGAAFAAVGQFTLQAGVTTANLQFAIGATGDLYFGDGLGGGSAYAADGTFLDAFALPGSVTGAAFTGNPYLSTDAGGGVYVFDTTGFHQYAVSAIPEPSTYAALLGLAAMIFTLRKRRGKNNSEGRVTR